MRLQHVRHRSVPGCCAPPFAGGIFTTNSAPDNFPRLRYVQVELGPSRRRGAHLMVSNLSVGTLTIMSRTYLKAAVGGVIWAIWKWGVHAAI